MERVKNNLLSILSEKNVTGVAYKNKNRKGKIINYLDQNGEKIIADIALSLNISNPKATMLINELIIEGIIEDYGKIGSTGGRPASKYGLAADTCFFIGVDVKHYHVNIGLLNLKKVLVAEKMHVPYLLEDTKESLDSLISIIKKFITEASVNPAKILSMCINLGGRINSKIGYSYSYFNFTEEPLTSVFERQIGIFTYVENDSRAMAYGEFIKGVVKEEKDVLFINLDFGLGLGILIDGKVYYGKSGFSGEFGHIPLFTNEIICHCGKKGCIETEASGRALIRLFKERIEQGSTSSIINNSEKLRDLRVDDIIKGALNEDMLCIDLLAEIGEKLGRGLAVLLHIFNSEMVILGGVLINAGDYIFLPIKSAFNKYSLSIVNKDTKLCVSELGEKAGIIGGCMIARNTLFSIT